MPFRDPEDRRRYDRERKRTIRAQARSAPIVLAADARVRVLGDVENLLAEAVRLVLSDGRATGVQKGRALGYLCSIGLRLIETHELGERLEALEAAMGSRKLKATG